jgi:hypothetical protein
MAEAKSTMNDILPEKWMRGVALTTTVLAVLTAIASSRAAYCVAQSQVLTAQEGSKWAFYQAKSIKQNIMESQLKGFEIDALGGERAHDQKMLLDDTINTYRSEIARYDDEKTDIRIDAEETGKKNVKISRQGGQFALSVVFFQIGIMLSSVSALLKRKEMWVVGLIMGVIATVYLVNAIFLLF